MAKERIILKEMPDKETLEQYVNQGRGDEKTKVSLNVKTGEFEWIVPKDKPSENEI